jgi:hypothetical protein
VRGIDVPTTGGTIDFNLAGGPTPATRAATLVGATAAETTYVATVYQLRQSAAVTAARDDLSPFTIRPLPATAMMAGDLVRIEGRATGTSTLRRVFTYHGGPEDTTLNLPPLIESVVISNVTEGSDPYTRIRAGWTAMTDADAYNLILTQGTLTWSIVFPASLDLATYTLPRLDGITGWDTAWGLAPGTAVSWVFEMLDFSEGYGHAKAPVAGEQRRYTRRTGML